MKSLELTALEKKNPLLALEFLTGTKEKVELADFSLPKKETEVFYVIGLGNKKWQQDLVHWLEKNQERKVFLIIHSSSYLECFLLDFLEHSQVSVGNSITSFVWDHLYQPWELVGGNSEEKEALSHAILGVELTFSLYQDYGICPLSNVIKNLGLEEKVRKGNGLAGKFKDFPAIICGAGPSLENSLETLKTVGDQALIFGGGSALGPLSKANIPLHFIAAVDPDPPSHRFLRQSYFETPLFYQNQVSHLLLKNHHGPKLCMGDSGSFPLENYLVEDLDLPFIDAGWNVATFATYVAYLLGCNPIYFVGMDLSVSQEASYAKGVEGEDARENPMSFIDRFGNNVGTRSDFLMAKKWLENFAQRHTETTFINVSKKGLSLEGIRDGEMTFSEGPFDLSSKIYLEIMQASFLEQDPFLEKIKGLKKSCTKILGILSDYLKDLAEENDVILHEYFLEEELFYQFYLLPTWEVWKYLLQNDTIVRSMEYPEMEKKLQEILFYQELTQRVIDERMLCI